MPTPPPHLAILLLALFRCDAGDARALVFRISMRRSRCIADGTIDVTETIEAQFTGAWHGIYRTIPVEYTDCRRD